MCLISCGNDESMVGTWAQPVPGLEGMKQGFTLEEGGKASSINMATLCYETWKQEGTLLILSGKSRGNRQTLQFSDTLTIEQLTQDSLVLKKGMLVLRYARETGEQGKMVSMTPTKEMLTLKGELVISAETRTFKPEGSSDTYWVIDKTGKLYREYDKVTGGIKNGTPVHAELQVEDAGKSKEGFAATYK
ncbi:lipocalin-like domain-containing protein, partial [Phocaeicola massiliensis]|uniref:lipocalin family protein n=1 Tax=Phocaeicola massiliensis TaxID=204516 RepID=UPI00202E5E8D|nr:lipocalin family protein [Phocaeicola massiliensis]MCM1708184.1 lipocalin family protein [Phocaeicola massiliensis]